MICCNAMFIPNCPCNISYKTAPHTFSFIYIHSTKKPVTTMQTYPWKCTVLHCNHLGNTWKPLVLMTWHFDYCPSASEGDNQSVRSSAPVVSRCFPGGYNVKLYISRGRLAWWLLAILHSDIVFTTHLLNHAKHLLQNMYTCFQLSCLIDYDSDILQSTIQIYKLTNNETVTVAKSISFTLFICTCTLPGIRGTGNCDIFITIHALYANGTFIKCLVFNFI